MERKKTASEGSERQSGIVLCSARLQAGIVRDPQDAALKGGATKPLALDGQRESIAAAEAQRGDSAMHITPLHFI